MESNKWTCAVRARRSFESGDDSVPSSDEVENAVEKKKRRLNEMLIERGEVDDGFVKRRMEEEQAIERRDKLNREISVARKSLLQNGVGMSFDKLPDDILYRIFSLLPFEDRMKARIVCRRMIEVEKKAGTVAEITPFSSLQVTVGESNSLSLLLKQRKSDLDDDCSEDSFCEDEPYILSFKNLVFSNAINILRIMGQTIAINGDLSLHQFCHLSHSDRVSLFDVVTRIKGGTPFSISCPDHTCDREKNTGPIPFSLLRPMIERHKTMMVIKCPVQATVEDLKFIHERMMRSGVIVFLNVIGSDVGKEYRTHLKATALPTDKVLIGMNKCRRNQRPELMRVRFCPNTGNDEKVVNVEDEESDDEEEEDEKEKFLLVSVIQNTVKEGEESTIDVTFNRMSGINVVLSIRDLVEINQKAYKNW